VTKAKHNCVKSLKDDFNLTYAVSKNLPLCCYLRVSFGLNLRCKISDHRKLHAVNVVGFSLHKTTRPNKGKSTQVKSNPNQIKSWQDSGLRLCRK